MSSRLSRALFRQDIDTDDDLLTSEPFGRSVDSNKTGDITSTMSPDLSEHEIVSSTDGIESDDHQMLTPKKNSSWSDEMVYPSSPYNMYSNNNHNSRKARHSSPTHAHIRSAVSGLSLFGSPKTPKMLKASKSPVFHNEERVQVQTLTPLLARGDGATSVRGKKRSRLMPSAANINPFTPTAMLLQQNKRHKGLSLDGSFFGQSNNSSGVSSFLSTAFVETDDDGSDGDRDSEFTRIVEKHVTEHDMATLGSRYLSDFLQLEEIGHGEFGTVFKCLNRVDGCIYAIKKSRKPTKGCPSEKRSLNEVFAHAVLGKHSRVVRYYSAWSEEDQMYIQNEYCDGGSLAALIDEMKLRSEKFSEVQLKKLLRHVAQGLKYIHSQNLVHMDIKPENIFICTNNEASLNNSLNKSHESNDDGFEEDESDIESPLDMCYKIGDLGLVSCQTGQNGQVEEGDCRYLPMEILQDNYSTLNKADIFALGLTVYEAATLTSLPKNGENWHLIRSGNMEPVPGYSADFNKLIKKMISPDPHVRPSATALLHDPAMLPYADKTKSQLRRELNNEKFKNEVLARQLEEASKCLKSLTPAPPTVPISNTKYPKRSRSVNIF
ncbi:Wee1-like protein kinase [Halotydeus destructor]|nr:Wee1-like protein kinase [Halotydeus destructor]